ncbi:MAG TPA: GvpL/GvpF family gas vesicle protein [Elainellaceae cyanobacterium]
MRKLQILVWTWYHNIVEFMAQIYTYAFFKPPSETIELPLGIEGQLDLVVSPENVAALVEPNLSSTEFQASDQRLMRAVLSHDRVIRDMFHQIDALLPLRFGTCFLSHDGLLEHVKAHSQNYLHTLSMLSGKAEYTIKLIPNDIKEQDTSQSASGRDYFLAKKRQYQTIARQKQNQEAERDRLLDEIRHLYPSMVRSDASEEVERLYILCDRQVTPPLSQHVQQWQSACSMWTLSLGDALPPYHFVE